MKEFLSKIETLDNIRQWEERDSIIKESVSQHSFKVSAIAVYLLKKLDDCIIDDEVDIHFVYNYDFFSSKVLYYAIMHDFDEAILGRDISHKVKYNDYNGNEIRECIDNFVANKSGEFKCFVEKPSEEVRLFVKFCDWIALYTFIVRNENMGCKTFVSEKEYCKTNIERKYNEVISMLKSYFNLRDYHLSKFVKLKDILYHG